MPALIVVELKHHSDGERRCKQQDLLRRINSDELQMLAAALQPSRPFIANAGMLIIWKGLPITSYY